MADVYGRLTGRAGVCLSTLGPGATHIDLPVNISKMKVDASEKPLKREISHKEMASGRDVEEAAALIKKAKKLQYG